MTDEQEKHKPAKGQMEIDWTRAKRRKWIDSLKLQPFSYIDAKDKVRDVCRTGTMKRLLEIIESYARDGGPCFLKLKTIIDRMDESESTVRRAVRNCVGRGLLKVDTSFYKGAASKYQIEWSEVAQAILDNPETTAVIDPTAVPREAQKPVVTPVELTGVEDEFTPVNLNVTPVKMTNTPVNLTSTPVNLTEEKDADTTTRTRAVLNHEFNHEREPEIKPCTADAAGHVEYSPLPQPPNGGWTRPLEPIDFANRETIQALYEHAIKFRFVLAVDRVRFFALAKYCQRMFVAEKVRDIGAYFTANLKARNWLGDPEDFRAARNAIEILDRGRR